MAQINIPNLPANWRTQVPGILGAVALGIAAYSQDGKINIRDPLLWGSVLFAVSNYFTKAKNVTGGTTPNSTNDPAAVSATLSPKPPAPAA